MITQTITNSKTQNFGSTDVKIASNLCSGSYTASEARDVIDSLVNAVNNFYKIQALKEWERDHCSDCHDWESKMRELRSQKIEMKQRLLRAHNSGQSIHLKSLIQLDFIDQS